MTLQLGHPSISEPSHLNHGERKKKHDSIKLKKKKSRTLYTYYIIL